MKITKEERVKYLKRLHTIIENNPQISNSKLAKLLKRNESTVSRQLKKLELSRYQRRTKAAIKYIEENPLCNAVEVHKITGLSYGKVLKLADELPNWINSRNVSDEFIISHFERIGKNINYDKLIKATGLSQSALTARLTKLKLFRISALSFLKRIQDMTFKNQKEIAQYSNISEGQVSRLFKSNPELNFLISK